MLGKDAVLAIDIGGSKIIIGIVDISGAIIVQYKQQYSSRMTSDEIIGLIFSLAERILSDHNNYTIFAVGVAVPGLTDSESGIWVESSFSGIKDVRISSILSRKLKLPVFIENDCNACAYGEKLFGSCKEINDFIWITISNGIGSGIIHDGKIYKGAYKSAGEIGHVNVVDNGTVCPCGNRGCLEAYAAGPGIVNRYKEKSINCNGAGVNYGAYEISQLAKKGDKAAIEVFRDTGYYMGKAISYAVNILNPHKVVLGGGVSLSADLFLSELRKTVNRMVYTTANRDLSIETTALSYEAALIGSAAIAINGIGLVNKGAQ
jgi:glucokinase-like ROK family protein